METPKLLLKKPKKSDRKPVQHPPPPPPSSSSASIATSAPPPPPQPQPPKQSFARRYKFLWPILLVCNFTVGAYLFMRTKKTDVVTDEKVEDVSTSSVPTTVVNAAVTEKPLATLPIVQPIKPREPIPEGQQRELFKWILEEKRKIKPRNAEEKKRIDEEKAILKHFIKSTSIPTL